MLNRAIFLYCIIAITSFIIHKSIPLIVMVTMTFFVNLYANFKLLPWFKRELSDLKKLEKTLKRVENNKKQKMNFQIIFNDDAHEETIIMPFVVYLN